MSKGNSGKSKKEIFREKTLALFYKKGFKATTMRNIAENMGFEVANVYNYIDNKESFLRLCLAEISKEFHTGIRNINESSMNSKDKIRAIIGLHVRLGSQKPFDVALLLDEWKNLKEPQLEKFLAGREIYEQTVYEILKRGIERREFKIVELDIATQTVLASLRWLYDWYARFGDKVNPSVVEQQIGALIFNGILVD